MHPVTHHACQVQGAGQLKLAGVVLVLWHLILLLVADIPCLLLVAVVAAEANQASAAGTDAL